VFIIIEQEQQKQEAKHMSGACRSKFYAWTRTHDLRITLPPSYAIGYYVELIIKKNIYKKYKF
jgi:hypothetical protein